jgi:hypothetical protein
MHRGGFRGAFHFFMDTSRPTPYVMFSRIERLNKNGSCSTMPICLRKYERE